MTTPEKWEWSFQQLGKALDRFEEVLQKTTTQDDIMVDAAIQRFEFCIELFRKSLQQLLFVFESVDAKTPKQTFNQAYRAEWINDEDIWVRMLQDRNRSSHTYYEPLAREIYARLPGYCTVMRDTYEFLQKEVVDKHHD